MTDDVTRYTNWCNYSHGHEMAQMDDGGWVHYEDYATLERRLLAVEQEHDALVREIGTAPEGTHPDESRPRAETWHGERANWIAEVAALRAALTAPSAPASEGEVICEMVAPVPHPEYPNVITVLLGSSVKPGDRVRVTRVREGE